MKKIFLLAFYFFFTSAAFGQQFTSTWYHSKSALKFDSNKQIAFRDGSDGLAYLSNISTSKCSFSFNRDLKHFKMKDSRSRTIGAIPIAEFRDTTLIDESVPRNVDVWLLVANPTASSSIVQFYFEKTGEASFALRAKSGDDILILTKTRNKDFFWLARQGDLADSLEVSFTINPTYPKWKLGVGNVDSEYFAVDGGKSPCILNGDGVKGHVLIECPSSVFASSVFEPMMVREHINLRCLTAGGESYLIDSDRQFQNLAPFYETRGNAEKNQFNQVKNDEDITLASVSNCDQTHRRNTVIKNSGGNIDFSLPEWADNKTMDQLKIVLDPTERNVAIGKVLDVITTVRKTPENNYFHCFIEQFFE